MVFIESKILSVIEIMFTMDRRSFLRSVFNTPSQESLGNYSQHHQQMLGSSTLDEWMPSAENPWDASAVNHIYHRLGFSAKYTEVLDALKMSPSELIDGLMSDAIENEKPAAPFASEEWYEKGPYQGADVDKIHYEDYLYQGAKFDIALDWLTLMAMPRTMLREKLTLFWHNHFVTEADVIYHPQNVYRHLDYLRRNVWGNFKQMVKDVTIAPAMLIYLDGVFSQKGMINENYAREMMELFTMGRVDRYGKENYRQSDVVAMAHSLAGWRYRLIEPYPEVLTPFFAPYYYDFDLKKSPFGADPKLYGLASSGDTRIEADVIELLFEKRGAEIAWHISKKFYTTFVYRGTLNSESEKMVEQLAEILLASNWELKPMIIKLFKSEHFFDIRFRGADIKSPVEYVVGMLRNFDVKVDYLRAGSIHWYLADTGQVLLNPPNVKGWIGYHNWLNTSSITKRNTDVAHAFIMGNGIEGRYINAHTGNNYDGISFTDEQVTAWSMQFDGVADDLLLFAKNIASFLTSINPSEEMLKGLLHRSGISVSYEWASFPDIQKIPYIRRIIFNIMMLAEFQLQ